jgi:glycosyltransferase involved in cell wall biosynthesis
MLRALDEKGGIGVYSANIVRELLDLDSKNDYVLFYRSKKYLGFFGSRSNVEERTVWAPHKTLWDQLSIPLACQRNKIDVVFHPKFTVPLLCRCKTVMTVHGADWLIPEYARFYKSWDVAQIKFMMPRYFRHAAAVISVSQLTSGDFNQVLDLPPGKIRTVYFGPARQFRFVESSEKIAAVRAKYKLPALFIFTLSKLAGGARKNIDGIFEGYRKYYEHTDQPIKLVIGGRDCESFREDCGIPEDGYGQDIYFPGWIDQADLPAVYSAASLFLYPSNLEAFPIPLTEAMACGTPIVTSRVNGLREIAGDAALFVDPNSSAEIADAMTRVLSDESIRRELSRKGLERSSIFSWDRCARETLGILESLEPSPCLL